MFPSAAPGLSPLSAELQCAQCDAQMANASLPLAKKYPVFLSADDIKGLEGLSVYMKEESGYAEIQKTKPDTIGYALNDSPAGKSLSLSPSGLRGLQGLRVSVCKNIC